MDASITDDRFDRDLRRRQLARRLISHKARTQTIFELTSLTRHQLATLRRRWLVTQETRLRGPSPKSFAVFFSSARARSEAAALATLCRVLGSAPRDRRASSGVKLSGLDVGERLCEIFEVYAACLQRPEFEFEHLALLARGLARGDAIAVGNCTICHGTILVDLFATRRLVCSHCLQCLRSKPDYGNVRSNISELSALSEDQTQSIQNELF